MTDIKRRTSSTAETSFMEKICIVVNNMEHYEGIVGSVHINGQDLSACLIYGGRRFSEEKVHDRYQMKSLKNT